MQIVTEKTINLTSKEYVLVDFYAQWCGPCKMISPFLERLIPLFPSIDFVKIDVDENPNFATKYNVMSIPTLILFKNGIEIERKIGFVTQQNLQNWFTSLL